MLHVKVKQSTIGPAHDPYGATELTARDGTKIATFYFDGLGTNEIELVDGELLVRHEEWHDNYGTPYLKVRMHLIELKARLLFKRFIGVDFDTLLTDYYNEEAKNYRPDPYHGGV